MPPLQAKGNRSPSHSSGFTLIEILVALVLVGLVYSIMQSDTLTSNRQLMEENANDIERAVRFSIDEAALRNTVVRLWFDLEQSPIEYAVEYGPSENAVIPRFNSEEESSLLTEESDRKKEKQFDNKFNRVEEFQEKNKVFHDSIRILGIGSALRKRFVSEGKMAIYIYPSGEKDESLIVLGNDQEMLQIEIDSFGTSFQRKYFTFEEEGDITELFEERKKLAKRQYEEWIK